MKNGESTQWYLELGPKYGKMAKRNNDFYLTLPMKHKLYRLRICRPKIKIVSKYMNFLAFGIRKGILSKTQNISTKMTRKEPER